MCKLIQTATLRLQLKVWLRCDDSSLRAPSVTSESRGNCGSTKVMSSSDVSQSNPSNPSAAKRRQFTRSISSSGSAGSSQRAAALAKICPASEEIILQNPTQSGPRTHTPSQDGIKADGDSRLGRGHKAAGIESGEPKKVNQN